ncbi:MAG: signal recognition particle-docking protein FtsY [Candidatus Marinimicrobia bacterium]|nr:signal recognition particle-docking protein FtsY [Candidatus Neomarinimicrobiota bacterium]MBT5096577.1 signal recognition particle-docking protein FtsY [Candidatus Neomarinimicrobiota bacterium]MBT7424134.1 signal recognition particle-docking protein FtsY [Candidatus Neomarinimicrobiota bacterium]
MALAGKIFKALKQTRDKISDAFDLVRKEKVSIESLDQLEETLILADIGIDTVEKALDVIKNNKKNNFIQEVENYLISVLPENINDEEYFSKPMVILMVGVNGTGKTTSCAKLAKYYKSQGKKVLMIAADTYRAAAVDQLKVWSSRLNVEMIYNESSNQPSSVLFDGLTAAKSQKSDIIIVDTAGRLQTSKNLMSELEKMYRLAKKNFSSFNINSLITIDASLGQNSLIQAKDFNSIINLDGAILTKMDGTAKGGIVFPLYNESNISVKFIGTGEDLNDLYKFNRNEYIQSILGINNTS